MIDLNMLSSHNTKIDEYLGRMAAGQTTRVEFHRVIVVQKCALGVGTCLFSGLKAGHVVNPFVCSECVNHERSLHASSDHTSQVCVVDV